MRKVLCDKKKGAWTKEEDEKLIDYIQTHGEAGCWRSLPQAAGLLRCGKSCRLRWINYLRPDLKRGNFSEDEEDLIIKLHALLGNRWSLIAGRLPGRSDNEVKNYWNSHMRRKLMKMGIDPNNHRVRPIHNNNNNTISNFEDLHYGNNEDNLCDHHDHHSNSSSATSVYREKSFACHPTGLPDLNLNLDLEMSNFVVN